MNLSSCGYCGVVYDKQRISYPNIYTDDTYSEIDFNKARLCDGVFEAIFDCPNCKLDIFYETGDKA